MGYYIFAGERKKEYENRHEMQSEQIMKFVRMGLLLFYPVLAVLIWIVPVPMFQNMPQFNKIALSVLIGLYTALRIYRLVRQNSHREP